jgi:hypothetical protein
MLTCTLKRVNAQEEIRLTLSPIDRKNGTGFFKQGDRHMADVQIEDGIIKVVQLDIQDPKAAAVLAEYPQVRWPEITRRAMKIGLGYLKGGGKD